MFRFLHRWVNAELADELAATQSKLRIAELEVDKLTEVVERDRKRIAAETAEFAGKIVSAEREAR